MPAAPRNRRRMITPPGARRAPTIISQCLSLFTSSLRSTTITGQDTVRVTQFGVCTSKLEALVLWTVSKCRSRISLRPEKVGNGVVQTRQMHETPQTSCGLCARSAASEIPAVREVDA